MRDPVQIITDLALSGLSPEQAELVRELTACLASSGDTRTARQARNARYYAKQRDERERLKASEKRLKASESEASEQRLKASENVLNSDAPRARREDNLLTTEGPCQTDDDDLRASDWPNDPLKAIVAEVASPWLDPSKSPGLITTGGNLNRWRREGASWEHDVLPVVRGVCAKARKPIGSWSYFDAAVSQAIADNRRALTLPEARGSPVVVNLTDRLAAEQAEARRLAFARLDARKNG